MNKEIELIIDSQGFSWKLTIDDIPNTVKSKLTQLIAPAPEWVTCIIWSSETSASVIKILEMCLQVKQKSESILQKYKAELD